MFNYEFLVNGINGDVSVLNRTTFIANLLFSCLTLMRLRYLSVASSCYVVCKH